MKQFRIVSFQEIGFDPAVYNGYTARSAVQQAFQLAGDYLMDTEFCEYVEEDVINWAETRVDWCAHSVVVALHPYYEMCEEYQ